MEKHRTAFEQGNSSSDEDSSPEDPQVDQDEGEKTVKDGSAEKGEGVPAETGEGVPAEETGEGVPAEKGEGVPAETDVVMTI